jgi:hypothetical protein
MTITTKPNTIILSLLLGSAGLYGADDFPHEDKLPGTTPICAAAAALTGIEMVQIAKFTSGCQEAEKEAFKRNLRLMSSAERTDCIKKLTILLDNDYKCCVGPTFIGAAENFSPAELITFTNQITSLFAPHTNCLFRTSSIETVISMPTAERALFTEQVTSLLTPDMDFMLRVTTIETVIDMSTDERTLFTEQVTGLFTPDMDGNHRAAIRRIVYQMPPHERALRVALVPDNIKLAANDLRYMGRLRVILRTPLGKVIPALDAGMAQIAAQGDAA